MVIKKLQNKELLIALVAFLAGVGLMYFYGQQEVSSVRKTTGRIINNCSQSLSVSNDLINSCSGAYGTVTACFSNVKSCNFQESAEQLDKYNQDKEKAESKLNSLVKDMDSIISSLNK